VLTIVSSGSEPYKQRHLTGLERGFPSNNEAGNRMHFENQATLAASRDDVWTFLMDVPQAATCVPGAEDVKQLDSDSSYAGVMKVRVGPISLSLSGTIQVEERDQAAGRAAMSAQATDRRVGGAVNAKITMTVSESSPGQTQLTVITDANVLGKLGEFGQPVIRKKSEQIMQQFVSNVQRKLSA
jgi:carbon monoxide dehydrogenase subunit G